MCDTATALILRNTLALALVLSSAGIVAAPWPSPGTPGSKLLPGLHLAKNEGVTAESGPTLVGNTDPLAVEGHRSETIVGTVADAVSDLRLSGAAVQLLKRSSYRSSDGMLHLLPLNFYGKEDDQVLTDQSGNFRIRVAVPEEPVYYALRVKATGYDDVWVTLIAPHSDGSEARIVQLLPSHLTETQIRVLEQKRIMEMSSNPAEMTTSGAVPEPTTTEVPTESNGQTESLRISSEATYSVPDEIQVRGLPVDGYSCGSGTPFMMNFDEFVMGVVTKELGDSFPLETLKAQAVAARAFALEQSQRGVPANCGMGYKSSITTKSRNATLNTTKSVVLYNGSIIRAYFSARCNGDSTLNSENSLGANCAAPCSSSNPPPCGQTNGSVVGYVRARACAHHDYQNCGSSGEIPCCHYFIEGRNQSIFGHGLGLCQRGAQNLGGYVSGQSWRSILNAYYTGVVVANDQAMTIGSSVRVTTSGTNLRDTPCGTTNGTANTGDTGTVVDGPQRPFCSGKLAGTDYLTWWRVSLNGQPAKWIAEDFIEATGTSGQNTGTINVNATNDGAPWPGSVNYYIDGPAGESRASVPFVLSGPPGTYTVTYVGGGPAGVTFTRVTPSSTQTVSAGGTVTFTLNFESLVCSAGYPGGVSATAASCSGQTLTVNKGGTGNGTVTSSPVGINCGSTCLFAFPLNSQVTLTASAASGSVFSNWSGACAGVSTQCTVTMSQAVGATANFTIQGSTTPTPTVTSPVGGENWQTGTTHNVTWSVSGSTTSINYWKIALSTDGGATWPGTNDDPRQLSGGVFIPGARSWQWTVESSWNTTQARIRVRALDANGTILGEGFSPSNFTISSAGETISAPAMPSGTTSGSVNTSYTFSTSGSTSNLGHPVQYQFDWGDGQLSGWLGVGTTSVSHLWPNSGVYSVRVQARCATHTSVVSTSSNTLSVTISSTGGGETISTPTTPSGPTIGTTSTSYTYSTSGSASSLGHSVQYQFDWGDGQLSGWLPVGTTSSSHSWTSAATYSVYAQARCATHTNISSNYSNARSVAVSGAGNQNYTLSVSGGGTGQGTVTGSGINCTISAGSANGACSTSYPIGTGVSLTATPTGSSTFGGWAGEGCGGIGGCQVTMSQARNVIATFTSAGGGTDLIDGGFESATATGNAAPGWSVFPSSGSGHSLIISNGPYPHSGSNYASLGGTNYTQFDALLQTVTIPSNATAPNLTLWANVITQEALGDYPYDFFSIVLYDTNGNFITTLQQLTNQDAAQSNNTAGNYFKVGPIDLSAFKGMTLQLGLIADTDSYLPTSFLIDDISLQTAAADNWPTTSITAPANGATVSGTVNVAATASDDHGVTSLEIDIDGLAKATNTNASSLSYSWNTTQASNGQHQIFSKAYDSAGHVTTSSVVIVTVANVVVTAPAAPTMLNAVALSSSSIAVSWADNSNNETGFVVYRWNGSAFSPITTVGANITSYTDTGLQASTAYLYIACAQNSGGTTCPSTSISATTNPPPPSPPSGMSAVALSSSAIKVSWVDNSTNETGFLVYRWNGSTWMLITTVGANVTSYTDTGLQSSTTYLHLACAQNAGGTACPGTSSSATTAPPPPAAPSGMSAVPLSSNAIKVSWVDNSINETGFLVYRWNGSTWVLITTVGANVTSYTDTGLQPLTTYSHIACAQNSGGSACPAISSSATTFTTPPAAPSGMSAVPLSSNAIKVSWVDNSSNETGFLVYRWNGSTWVLITTVGANVTSYTDTGLQPLTTYSHIACAQNSGGSACPAISSSATTFPAPPVAPSGMSAAPLSSSSIKVSWVDNANNETGFLIYRWNGSSWAQIATVAANVTSYTDTGLQPGTTYLHLACAQNSGGTSCPSTSSSATTLNTLPAAPSGMNAVALSSSSIKVSWVDNANNETGFLVYRWNGSAWTQISTVGADVTSYTDTGLQPQTTYMYLACAQNSGGTTCPSTSGSATTFLGIGPPAPPAMLNAVALSTSSISVSWTDNSSNETGFLVYRWNGSTWIQIATVGANVTSYTDTGLLAGTQYRYIACAQNVAGTNCPGTFSTATTQGQGGVTPPMPPTGMSAISLSTSSIKVSWVDNANNEAGFIVYRWIGSTWFPVGTVGANVTSYTDTGLQQATTYYHIACAQNVTGTACPSAYSTATTPIDSGGTAPVAPSGMSAVALSPTSIQVSWVDNSSNENGFIIYRWNGSAWAQVGTAGANLTSYTDNGLQPSTTYYHIACAQNSVGSACPSSYSTAATPSGGGATAPAAPSGMSAVALSSSSIQVSWVDNSSNETGFVLYRWNGSTWVQIATVGANVTSYIDTGLQASTAYRHIACAQNALGTACPNTYSTATTH